MSVLMSEQNKLPLKEVNDDCQSIASDATFPAGATGNDVKAVMNIDTGMHTENTTALQPESPEKIAADSPKLARIRKLEEKIQWLESLINIQPNITAIPVPPPPPPVIRTVPRSNAAP
jgi:hypothetical protein